MKIRFMRVFALTRLAALIQRALVLYPAIFKLFRTVCCATLQLLSSQNKTQNSIYLTVALDDFHKFIDIFDIFSHDNRIYVIVTDLYLYTTKNSQLESISQNHFENIVCRYYCQLMVSIASSLDLGNLYTTYTEFKYFCEKPCDYLEKVRTRNVEILISYNMELILITYFWCHN